MRRGSNSDILGGASLSSNARRERKSRHECHAPSFARARARRRFFAPWRLCVLAFNRKGAKTQRRGEHGLAASPRDRRVAALGSADTSIAEPAGCRQRRLRVAVPDWTGPACLYGTLGDSAREHKNHILLPELLRPERLHLFRSTSSISRLAQEDAEASRPY